MIKKVLDMARFKSKNIGPERRVRMMFVRRQIKFLCQPRVPGLPRRTADFRVGNCFIFVNGRSWQDPAGRSSVVNTYRGMRRVKNAVRDRETYRHLISAGYRVVVIWDDTTPAFMAQLVMLAIRLGRTTVPAVPVPELPSCVVELTSRKRTQGPVT